MDDHAVLLTVPEAAKLLRISRNLAYGLVGRGELPSVRLGRVIRVPRASLEEWLTRESSSLGLPIERHRLDDKGARFAP